MQRTSADLLEYADLKRLIGRYVAGPFGRMQLEALHPSADRASLEEQLAHTAEAVEYARTVGRLSIGGLVDSTESVQKLRIEGAGLDGKEIADLTTFLERAMEVKL